MSTLFPVDSQKLSGKCVSRFFDIPVLNIKAYNVIMFREIVQDVLQFMQEYILHLFMCKIRI